MTTHWMSPIERLNPRVMAGQATLTDVSSCTAPVPSPITATCQDLVFKRAANVLISSCLEIEGTSQCSWCDFCPATKIHQRRGVARACRQKEFRDSGGLAKSGLL